MSIAGKIKVLVLALCLAAFSSCTGGKKGGKGCDCPSFGQKEIPINPIQGENS